MLGSDRRAKSSTDAKLGQAETPHSDTIVLIRLDPKRNRIAVLSLPRDLAVTIPGYADNTKINQAYDEGGAAQDARDRQATCSRTRPARSSRSTASSTSTSTASSRRSTTSRASTSTSTATTTTREGTGFAAIDIKAGYQRLVGSDALAYVRYRHTDSDLFRNARQQDFLRQAANQPAVEKLKSLGEASELRAADARQYFRFDKKFLTRKNIAGLLKTGVSLAFNHAPVNQIALDGDHRVRRPDRGHAALHLATTTSRRPTTRS